MEQQRKDNSGALFKNERKQKETHADYQGKATIGGKDYYLSAWVRDGKNGKYFSMSFKAMDEARQAASKQEPAIKQESARDPDDDIPF